MQSTVYLHGAFCGWAASSFAGKSSVTGCMGCNGSWMTMWGSDKSDDEISPPLENIAAEKNEI